MRLQRARTVAEAGTAHMGASCPAAAFRRMGLFRFLEGPALSGLFFDFKWRRLSGAGRRA